ncbi:hypothetical protein G6F37_012110 [Rhizopus arrhizus]|nr:hypothetical protein G6F37_012110 [Rhizopus arrhizus]
MVYHTLWSLLDSVCIHQSLSPHSRLGSLKIDQTFGILRRLVTDSTYQGNRFAADTTGSQQIAPIGLDDQRSKINLGSDSAIGTPRFRIGHNYYEGGTPEEKGSRLEEINFTSTTTSFETDSQIDTQFNDASTVVTVCDSSGSFVHKTPTQLQKSGSEISFGLGHASTTRQRINPRADMVVHQLGEMERTVIYPHLSTGNNICRRERHGLGMLVEQADHSWLLDSNGSESINQFARTEGSLVGNASIPVSEEHHHIDQNRQSHQLSVYQQTGRHSLPASPQLSDRSLELVPRTQYNCTSPTHSRDSQQGCRLRVSSSIPEESMANSPLGVCSSPTALGSVRCRSVCGSYDLPPSKIRVLASRSWSVAC